MQGPCYEFQSMGSELIFRPVSDQLQTARIYYLVPFERLLKDIFTQNPRVQSLSSQKHMCSFQPIEPTLTTPLIRMIKWLYLITPQLFLLIFLSILGSILMPNLIFLIFTFSVLTNSRQICSISPTTQFIRSPLHMNVIRARFSYKLRWYQLQWSVKFISRFLPSYIYSNTHTHTVY